MVVDGQLADHRDDRVGVTEIVAGDVGQAFDLAHHVVPEVADQATVKGWEIVELGRPVVREQSFERLEHALGGVDVDPEIADDSQRAVFGDQGALGTTPDERPPAPPVAVLHRLQQEALFLPDHSGEGGDRGGQVGEHFGPHGNDGVLGSQRLELLERGPNPHQPKVKVSGSVTLR